MKLDKLAKNIRRDLVANPMKSGVLGALLLGGMYFWGPLLWKWVGKRETAAAPVAAVVSTQDQVIANVPTGTGVAEKGEPGRGWREIQDRRNSDPLVRSADFQPQWKQIFQVAATATATTTKSQVDAKAKKQLELDPRDVGLVLQGIAIGPKAKKAIISGKVYRELDSITVRPKSDPANNKEDQLDVEFRLRRVFARMVELERGGKTWQLRLTSAKDEEKQVIEAVPAIQPKDVSTDEKPDSRDKPKTVNLQEE